MRIAPIAPRSIANILFDNISALTAFGSFIGRLGHLPAIGQIIARNLLKTITRLRLHFDARARRQIGIPFNPTDAARPPQRQVDRLNIDAGRIALAMKNPQLHGAAITAAIGHAPIKKAHSSRWKLKIVDALRTCIPRQQFVVVGPLYLRNRGTARRSVGGKNLLGRKIAVGLQHAMCDHWLVNGVAIGSVTGQPHHPINAEDVAKIDHGPETRIAPVATFDDRLDIPFAKPQVLIDQRLGTAAPTASAICALARFRSPRPPPPACITGLQSAFDRNLGRQVETDGVNFDLGQSRVGCAASRLKTHKAHRREFLRWVIYHLEIEFHHPTSISVYGTTNAIKNNSLAPTKTHRHPWTGKDRKEREWMRIRSIGKNHSNLVGNHGPAQIEFHPKIFRRIVGGWFPPRIGVLISYQMGVGLVGRRAHRTDTAI